MAEPRVGGHYGDGEAVGFQAVSGSCEWKIDESSDTALRRNIQAILRGFNAEAGVSGPDSTPLNLRATGTTGSFVGGLVGETYWDWLVVDVLAVKSEFRWQGLGSGLVEQAEATAVSRGCSRAHTTAWAFQGLGFWQKMGYEIVGELSDHPEGHTLYWLRRSLA